MIAKKVLTTWLEIASILRQQKYEMRKKLTFIPNALVPSNCLMGLDSWWYMILFGNFQKLGDDTAENTIENCRMISYIYFWEFKKKTF